MILVAPLFLVNFLEYHPTEKEIQWWIGASLGRPLRGVIHHVNRRIVELWKMVNKPGKKNLYNNIDPPANFHY